jgi:D-alanyl-D-alanine endopeptidase (penicillin-binding protein 7)
MKYIFSLLLLLSSNAWAWANASSILVIDVSTSRIIYEHNSNSVRPIASITKLMTAMVSLELYGLNDYVMIGKKQKMSVKELLTRLLVRSDNNAAGLLAKHHPQGRSAFLSAMNTKAKSLNLQSTVFDDPSGLSSDNISTAAEVAALTIEASKFDFIREISVVPQTKQFTNTNFQILKDYHNILVSKTGFTSAAGRCLTMLVDHGQTRYVIIILGELTKVARETTARSLLQVSANKYNYN